MANTRLRSVHDGKAGCNTVEYTTAVLYSDWLYLPRHGIKIFMSLKRVKIQTMSKSTVMLNTKMFNMRVIQQFFILRTEQTITCALHFVRAQRNLEDYN